MFGSTVLEVAVGLIFVFLTVSLVSSALTETFVSIVKLRQGTLRAGIQVLLNDKDFTKLALALYNHALVNPLSSGAAAKKKDLTANPSYIDPAAFATALVTTLEAQNQGRPLADAIMAIEDEQLCGTLAALLAEAQGDRTAFQAAIGVWFDHAMDRVSGWYKRYTQLISFFTALLVCVSLNADGVHIARVLWQAPSLRAQLAADNLPSAAEAIQELKEMSLLGWSNASVFDPRSDVARASEIVFGWLLVAAASLYGAPFWFSVLQRITQVASAGPGIKRAAKV